MNTRCFVDGTIAVIGGVLLGIMVCCLVSPADVRPTAGVFIAGDQVITQAGSGVVLERLGDADGKRRYKVRIQGELGRYQEVTFFEEELKEPGEKLEWTSELNR